MNPTEVAFLGIAINAFIIIGGAFYVHGKKDSDSNEMRIGLNKLIIKVDSLETAFFADRASDAGARGEQNALNTTTRDLFEITLRNRERISRTETQLSSHEEDCERRYSELLKRLDRVDDRLEHSNAEIRNLALNLSNRIIDVPSNTSKSSR